MVIMAPSDEKMAWQMLNTGYHYNGPAAVRYPRGIGTGAFYDKNHDDIKIGKSSTVVDSDQKDVVILSFGTVLDDAIQSGEKFNARVVDMRFVKPLDHDLSLIHI